MISFPTIQSPIQTLISNEKIQLSILREDLILPEISGNKFRKLKYNLLEFQNGNYDALLTFGGAFSNHIAAVAAAGKEFQIPTIGIIRGDELQQNFHQNPTLYQAHQNGMKLHFVTRAQYRHKNSEAFLETLKSKFGNIFILPEGGSNALAVKGCEEILSAETDNFDLICCAVGTGGTISGIINRSSNKQLIYGFPALKDSDFLISDIKNWTSKSNWELISDYHFGGYAKFDEELIDFINVFKREYNVPLEPIYTGKMMYGIMQMIRKNHFPTNTKILAVHTGGLQGVDGFNEKLKKQNKNYII